MKASAAICSFCVGLALGGIIYESFAGAWLKVAVLVVIGVIALTATIHLISREGR